MINIDREGFFVGPPGLALATYGDVVDLMYKRYKTEKWYIMWFPWHGLDGIYRDIEEKFYKPGSNKNKGFEIAPMPDKSLILVFCYKNWMSHQQLTKLVNDLELAPFFKIPEGKDLIFMELKDEPIIIRGARMSTFVDFNDYVTKQETGT